MNGCSPLIYNWRYILVALPATIRFSITTAPCDLRGGVNCGAWCNALGAILFWSWYGSDNNRVGEREGAETTNRNNNMLPSGVTSLFPVRMYSSNRKSFINFRLYPRGADSVRWRKITHFHEGEQDHGWWPKSPFELAVLFFYFIPKKKNQETIIPFPGRPRFVSEWSRHCWLLHNWRHVLCSSFPAVINSFYVCRWNQTPRSSVQNIVWEKMVKKPHTRFDSQLNKH